MNEQEKMPLAEAEASVSPCTAEVSSDNVCVETESPAEAISEAADAIDKVPDVHDMSKEELLAELRDIVEQKRLNSHREVTAIRQALYALRQREVADELNAFVGEGHNPTDFASSPDPAEEEVRKLVAEFKDARNEYLREEEARKEANLERKKAIVAEIESLAADIDNVNLHFPKFQELQKAFKESGEVPATSETEIWKNFKSVEEKFYDCLSVNKELRALDFKKNFELKRNLVEQAKALAEVEDVVEAARRLQNLHSEWRETGPVAKEIREEIWEEFKAASQVVNKRHQEYFESRKETEKANEEGKTKICEEIEAIDTAALTSFSAWDEAQEKIKDMQARWRTFGPAARKVNNELYARFRKSCDEFFAAKAAYTREQRDKQTENLARKTELCEKAEALKDAENLTESIDKVIKLQAEWKTIGSVGRKYSDEIWKRFMDACNYLFDARRKQQNGRRNEENANLEKKRSIVARIKEIPLDIDRKEGLVQIKALQNEWQEVGHVPFKQKDKIYAEYREACDALYEAFNSGRTRERRQNFESQLSNMKGDESKMGRERDRLVRAIEQKRNEVKTYENNLGFFRVKSSEGNGLVRDMERKMARLKEEITELQEKIRMIDAAE